MNRKRSVHTQYFTNPLSTQDVAIIHTHSEQTPFIVSQPCYTSFSLLAIPSYMQRL
ncbi:hypothetical protein [Porphyromonas gingivicanis]|uniref:hypothetical protein n=1 Tax=Porphyromonas gingivicanis TaxID=266762 RepID=UPI000AE65C6C|nr:hypothetical protein [Porphyromonas gingivicanis]